MATTPEGKVKQIIRDLLAEYDGMYAYWPVPSGFGKRTIDVLGCYRGLFFAIEAKRDGKQPTLLQVGTINDIEKAMGKTFVIAGEGSPVLGELRAWLDKATRDIYNDPHLTRDPVARRPI
jgi:hypothetical protein